MSQADMQVSCTPGEESSTKVKIGLLLFVTSTSPTCADGSFQVQTNSRRVGADERSSMPYQELDQATLAEPAAVGAALPWEEGTGLQTSYAPLT